MTRMFTLASCLAMSMCLAQVATAQGPVRRAVRGAGEVTAGAARATAQGVRGAGEVGAGAARATAQGVRGVGEVAAGAARVTARGVRAGVDAITPGIPIQANAGGPIDRNARWRFQQHNGDWWYYAPNNKWSYYRNNSWSPYAVETFTPNQQYAGSSDQSFDAQQTVFIDSGGRAVLCQNGHVAFLDGTSLQTVSRSQVNAQGYLVQQGQAPGQAGLGTVGSAQINQDAGVQQSSYQGDAQAGVQQSTGGQAQGQVPVQGALDQNQAQNQPTPQPANDVQDSAAPASPTAPPAATDVATRGISDNR